eukprot:961505-Pelagomonas_calceolata.AAC.4
MHGANLVNGSKDAMFNIRKVMQQVAFECFESLHRLFTVKFKLAGKVSCQCALPPYTLTKFQ